MLQLKELKIEAGSEAFDLDFKSAATTVVLGRNNSGKTNLLRFIAGLSTGAQGKLLLDGEDISASKPQQRPVALVVQNFVNYPNWSVEENILSPLVNKGISKSYSILISPAIKANAPSFSPASKDPTPPPAPTYQWNPPSMGITH